jgi:hypothetical protein
MLYRNAEPVLRAQNADENALYIEREVEEGETVTAARPPLLMRRTSTAHCTRR